MRTSAGAGLLEGGQVLADGVHGGGDRRRNGEREELRVVTQSGVQHGDAARPAGAVRAGPDVMHGEVPLREVLRGPRSLHPAAGVGGEGAGGGARVPRHERAPAGELVEREVDGPAVVAADGDREPAAADAVEAGALAREDPAVVQGRCLHQSDELDAPGGDGGEGESDQRLVAVVDDAPGDGEAREAVVLGGAGPGDELATGRTRRRGGEEDSSSHAVEPGRAARRDHRASCSGRWVLLLTVELRTSRLGEPACAFLGSWT